MIPKEEEASVKDSLTPELLAKGRDVGGEASGCGGRLVLSIVEWTKL